jgi:hypothetical protein
MRETTLDNKIELLSTIYLLQKDSEFFGELLLVYNVGFPLAFMSDCDYADSLTDKGVEAIEETWLVLLELLEVEDIGYTDYLELLRHSENYQKHLEEYEQNN